MAMQKQQTGQFRTIPGVFGLGVDLLRLFGALVLVISLSTAIKFAVQHFASLVAFEASVISAAAHDVTTWK